MVALVKKEDNLSTCLEHVLQLKMLTKFRN